MKMTLDIRLCDGRCRLFWEDDKFVPISNGEVTHHLYSKPWHDEDDSCNDEKVQLYATKQNKALSSAICYFLRERNLKGRGPIRHCSVENFDQRENKSRVLPATGLSSVSSMPGELHTRL